MNLAVASPIVVTGAAGFIGYHTASRLLQMGRRVVGLDNVNSYYSPQLKRDRLAELARQPGFSFHELDLADASGIAALVKSHEPDSVIHLAAQAGVRWSIENPRAYIDSNVVGFLSILEACRHAGVGHLLYASSSSVYGANTKLPFSVGDTVDHPVSLYAATKKANELMAHTYSHLYGLPTTGLRFFTVYGPWGRPDMAMWKFTKAILAGEPIELYNHGQMRRDFTYVDDVVESIVRLSARPATPNPEWNSAAPDPATSSAPWRVYNIGNHTPVELLRVVELLESHLDRKAIRRLVDIQPGDVPATYADVTALASAVGFSPATPISEGIARFVTWYRSYHGV
ncbi:MAG: NAD-dependent epimerase [Planctomycetia bacterium]|nr:NAD-dependent epimerase [Planctomycetia bacterium]